MQNFTRPIRALFIRFFRIRKQFIRFLHNLFSHIRNAEQILTVLLAIIIGILGAYGAIGFRKIISWSHALFFGSTEYTLSIIENFSWYHKILLPMAGGLLVGPIVYYLAREVRGSGVPEVMESVARHGGIIRLRVLFTKAIAAALTIGSGGSAGREGPIIHIGAAIGSAIGQLTGISMQKMRTFVACGSAAGIAATFNAPIAGALFAVEVIVGDFAISHFSPIVISSVVATVLSRHYMGDFPAFDVPQYDLISPFEFIPYSILGIIAGLISVLFIYMVYKNADVFDRLKFPAYLKAAVGGMLVGIIAIYFPQIYGVGYNSINQALWGQDVSWLLFVLIFAKLIATSLTLGSGGSGGIFAPSLFIGAMTGALVGEIANQIEPDLTANIGAYALVGMGAVVSGTTHAPITAILIIFELTNDYRIIPPLMLTCILSLLVSTYFKKESMYTMKLVRKGIDIFKGKDINILRQLLVDSVISPNYEAIPNHANFSKILQVMLQTKNEIIFVTAKNQKLVGIITMPTVKEFLLDRDFLSDLVIAADLCIPPPATLLPGDNLDLVMHQFGRHDFEELPVIENTKNQKLIGVVKRKDIIEVYNREIFKLDLAGGMHSVVTAVKESRNIEISEGFQLIEIEPPAAFIGQSIKNLDVRRKYGLEVILIRHNKMKTDGIQNRPGSIPSPDYKLKIGDKLLVLGTTDQIQKFESGSSTGHKL